MIILAGTPSTILLLGISDVTTAFAAIVTLSPIVTPPKTVDLSPIQTLLPIVIPPFDVKERSAGLNVESPNERVPWLLSLISTNFPVRNPFPIRIEFMQVIWLYSPILQLSPICIEGLNALPL